MKKNSIVIGASPNPERYSYRAVNQLKQHGHPVTAVGLREGNINGINIETNKPIVEKVDTITLYVGKKNQPEWYDYIFQLNPKRIIFNPGAENEDLVKLANEKNIETIEACTLVMLSVGNY